MDQHVTEWTKDVIVVGGLRKCGFFMDQVERAFGERIPGERRLIIGASDTAQAESHAVAHGAHLRYGDIDTHKLRSTGSFGLCRDEYLDERLHADVVRGTSGLAPISTMRQSGRLRLALKKFEDPDPLNAREDKPYDPLRVYQDKYRDWHVKGRWLSLLENDEPLGSDGTSRKDL